MSEAIGEDEKRCTKCKDKKKITEFSTKGKGPTIRASRCKACKAEDNREAYKDKYNPRVASTESTHANKILNKATRAISAAASTAKPSACNGFIR